MSTVRITQRLMIERSLTALQTGAGRLARSQEQLSSGRLINRPSDSPTGANSAMRLRDHLAANTQHGRNASDGLAWLGVTDSTLSSMLDGTRRARELILRGTSTGSTGADARESLATEIDRIRESMLDLANTRYLNRPVFGGTTGGAVAYAADGSFQGVRDSVVTRRVGEGLTVQVNTTGPTAFGQDGDNLFDVLQRAADHLRNSPADLGDSLNDLDAVRQVMTKALAEVGTRYGRVESALSSVQHSALNLKSDLSGVENVDIAKAIVDLKMLEVAHQSALGATARVLQPSLIDFLR